ncbi:hypothetical protein FUA23_02075 [Neolewinella aurantiaca]|uniref:Uncharacterized protein n=1 Tax=Neolewinella aurantiaca TaxID=2602767 RepID=A0A5C7FJQ2_9BACT|nr:hypothetical protein [Neolewinella aurantiaca]TXF91506.1 hypothetical protein FUA23_02075 [Neolewinella aurantiaca]
MVQRLIVFLLFLTACSGNRPDVLLDNSVVSVVRQPLPDNFDARAFQQYNHKPGRVVLNGGAVAIIGHLAGTQVQWLQSEEAEFLNQSLVVVPKVGRTPEDPEVLSNLLEALDAKLVETGDTNQYVFLRSAGLKEDIVLSTSLQETGMTQNAALYQFDTAGVHLMNNTGIPLRMDQEVIDFYLPALVEFYGEGIDSVDFWLEVRPYVGVRLVRN